MIERAVAGEVVKVSRVGSPRLRHWLERDHDVVVVPAIAGLTVWEHEGRRGLAVVERPNRVGRMDRPPRRGRWEGIDVAVQPGEVTAATRLRSHLIQIRGVVAPWDPVEAPWFVVLLPVDPRPVAASVGSAELLDLPEFPGGLLVDTRRGAGAGEARQYAAAVEAAMAAALKGE